MIKNTNDYKLRKLSIGLVSVCAGVLFAAQNKQVIKADDVNNQNSNTNDNTQQQNVSAQQTSTVGQGQKQTVDNAKQNLSSASSEQTQTPQVEEEQSAPKASVKVSYNNGANNQEAQQIAHTVQAHSAQQNDQNRQILNNLASQNRQQIVQRQQAQAQQEQQVIVNRAKAQRQAEVEKQQEANRQAQLQEQTRQANVQAEQQAAAKQQAQQQAQKEQELANEKVAQASSQQVLKQHNITFNLDSKQDKAVSGVAKEQANVNDAKQDKVTYDVSKQKQQKENNAVIAKALAEEKDSTDENEATIHFHFVDVDENASKDGDYTKGEFQELNDPNDVNTKNLTTMTDTAGMKASSAWYANYKQRLEQVLDAGIVGYPFVIANIPDNIIFQNGATYNIGLKHRWGNIRKTYSISYKYTVTYPAEYLKTHPDAQKVFTQEADYESDPVYVDLAQWNDNINANLNKYFPSKSLKLIKNTDPANYNSSTQDFNKPALPKIPGYTIMWAGGIIKKTESTPVAGGNSITTYPRIYEIMGTPYYQANPEKLTVNFLDDDENEKVVQSEVDPGKYSQSIKLDLLVPSHYTLAPGQTLPTSYTFTADNNQHIDIHLKHIIDRNISNIPDGAKTTDGQAVVPSDLQQDLTRTIIAKEPTGDLDLSQHTNVSRTGNYDEVTGVMTFNPWTTSHFDQVTSPAVTGYVPSIDSVPAANTVTHDFKDPHIIITYTAGQQRMTYTYWDDTENKQIGSPFNLAGKTGQTVNTNLTVPDGYELATGSNIPDTYTFKANGNNPVTIHFVHKIITVDKTPAGGATDENGNSVQDTDFKKDVIRTITAKEPDKDVDLSQHATLTRTGEYDEVTRELKWNSWSTATLPAVNAPQVNGYKPDISVVSEDTATSSYTDPHIVIHYSAEPQSMTYIYWDDTDNQAMGNPVNLEGTTGQTVKTGLTIPDGYELASGNTLPDTYTFKANGNNTVTIHFVKSKRQAKYIFVDDDNNESPVGEPIIVTGNSNEKGVQTGLTVPANYELAKGQTLPTTVDFGTTNPADTTIHLVHQKRDVSSTDPKAKSTVTRTINIINPDGSVNTVHQSVTFTRQAIKDMVTGQTAYGAWSENGKHTFNEVDAPEIQGYKANGKADAIVVTPDSQDSVVNIDYSQVKQPATVNNVTNNYYGSHDVTNNYDSHNVTNNYDSHNVTNNYDSHDVINNYDSHDTYYINKGNGKSRTASPVAPKRVVNNGIRRVSAPAIVQSPAPVAPVKSPSKMIVDELASQLPARHVQEVPVSESVQPANNVQPVSVQEAPTSQNEPRLPQTGESENDKVALIAGTIAEATSLVALAGTRKRKRN